MNEKVEESFPKSRIHSFLSDIMKLCNKHKVNIYTGEVDGKTTTMLDFFEWEKLSELEVYHTFASVYWSRIESHVVHEEKVNG